MTPRGGRARRAAWAALFGLGVVLGVVLLPVSLELGVAIAGYPAQGRTLLQLVYPVALALGGFGAAIQAARGGAPDTWGRVAGAGLVSFLAWILLVGLEDRDTLAPSLLLVGGSLAAAFVGGGAALGAGLRACGAPDQGWVAHVTGLAIGYAACSPLLDLVGANAILAISGLALLLAGLSPGPLALVLLSGLAIAPPVHLDAILESARAVDRVVDAPDRERRRESLRRRIADASWLGWSRYGQVAVVPVGEGETPGLAVLANRARQYTVSADDREGQGRGGNAAVRRALYGALPVDGRALVIGVGSARGLLAFPNLDERVTGVERDPAAFRYFAQVNPDANGRVYERARLLNADGRHALSTEPGPWDLIAYESAIYQPQTQLLPATTPYFLLTAEALATSLDRLSPGGLLLVEFLELGHGRRAALPDHVARWFSENDVPFRQLEGWGDDEAQWTLAAAHTEETLAGWLGRIGPSEEVGVSRPEVVLDAPLLTDDRPFLTWIAMGERARLGLLLAALACCVLPGLVIAGCAVGPRRVPLSRAVWFGLVGAASFGVQLHAFHAWRSLLGDELGTILALIVAFLAWGAVGGLVAVRLQEGPRWRIPAASVGLGAAWLVVLATLPHTTGSPLVTWGWTLLGAAPAGLLIGSWMPLGLRRTPVEALPRVLAADAAGTLAGYGLSWLVLLPFGTTAYGWFVAGMSAIVVVGAARAGAWGAGAQSQSQSPPLFSASDHSS